MEEKQVLDSDDYRFGFGKNWSKFLEQFNEERLAEGVLSLQKKLGVDSLKGKTFLDIGCGSGLFSLSAYKLGAKVTSFDYDQNSVNCAKKLKDLYLKEDQDWEVRQASVLDKEFIDQLPEFDVVYSWGVLHHTGHMWLAIENAMKPVKKGGLFFIAIYNDQRLVSKLWYYIKKLYNTNLLFKILLVPPYFLWYFCGAFVIDILQLKNPVNRHTGYRKRRGMMITTDLFDWLGGYPFEVAAPEEIFDFVTEKGYRLVGLKTVYGKNGCNEFVFLKE